MGVENRQLLNLFVICIFFWYIGFPFIGAAIFTWGFQLHEEIIDEVYIDYLFDSEVDDPDYYIRVVALHSHMTLFNRKSVWISSQYYFRDWMYFSPKGLDFFTFIDNRSTRELVKILESSFASVYRF